MKQFFKKHSKKIARITVIFLGITTAIYFPVMAKQNQQQQVQREFVATMHEGEWFTLIDAVNNPDNYSVNQRKDITKNLQSHLSLVDSTKKK